MAKFYDPCPFPGINRKVLNKTRIIQKFVWFKKLKGRWKFLTTAYIYQKCLKNEQGLATGYSTTCVTKEKSEKYLDWYNVDWVEKPLFFLKCPGCDNELTASGSFISDDEDVVKYRCTDCGRESFFYFGGAPVPIEITYESYRRPSLYLS